MEEIRDQDPLEFTNEININSIERIHGSIIRGLSYLSNVTEMKISCDEGLIKFNTTLMMNQTEILYNLTRPFGKNSELNVWMKAIDFQWNLLIFVNTTNGTSLSVHNVILQQPTEFIIGSGGNGMLDPSMRRLSFMPVKFYIEKILNYVIEKKVEIVIQNYGNNSV